MINSKMIWFLHRAVKSIHILPDHSIMELADSPLPRSRRPAHLLKKRR